MWNKIKTITLAFALIGSFNASASEWTERTNAKGKTVLDYKTSTGKITYRPMMNNYRLVHKGRKLWANTISELIERADLAEDIPTPWESNHATWTVRNGIADAWAEGYTGRHKSILNIDGSNPHGRITGQVIKDTAPGADVYTHLYNDKIISGTISKYDVINTSTAIVSSGRANSAIPATLDRLLSKRPIYTELKESGVLTTISSRNNSGRCDLETIGVGYCNLTAIHLTGELTDDVEYIRDADNTTIVVGGFGGNRQFGTRAGILKEDFLVASFAVNSNNLGGVFQGTSGSSPVVAGAAAIVMDKFEDLSAIQVKNILLESADERGSCTSIGKSASCSDINWGHGILNVTAALSPVGNLN